VTDVELGAFLCGPRNPEHEALLRLIGASILDPRGAEVDDGPAAVNTGREWLDGELNELGKMLVRGLPMPLAGAAGVGTAGGVLSSPAGSDLQHRGELGDDFLSRIARDDQRSCLEIE
jgi:hypothetical protein